MAQTVDRGHGSRSRKGGYGNRRVELISMDIPGVPANMNGHDERRVSNALSRSLPDSRWRSRKATRDALRKSQDGDCRY